MGGVPQHGSAPFPTSQDKATAACADRTTKECCRGWQLHPLTLVTKHHRVETSRTPRPVARSCHRIESKITTKARTVHAAVTYIHVCTYGVPRSLARSFRPDKHQLALWHSTAVVMDNSNAQLLLPEAP